MFIILENLKIEDINDRTVDILVPKEYESLINKAKDLKDVQIDLVLAKKTGNTSVKLSNKTLLDSLKKKVG